MTNEKNETKQSDSIVVVLRYQDNISIQDKEDVICTNKNSKNSLLINDNIQQKSDDVIVF